MFLKSRFKTWIPAFAGMTGVMLLPACHPPRSPVIVRPLPIEGKVETKPETKAPSDDTVRIGIRIDESEVSVASLGVIEAVNLTNNKKESWPPGKYLISAKHGDLLVQGNKLGPKWRFRPEDRDKYLQTGDKGYHGSLVLRVTGEDKITVVNETSIDDYLKGVLPREVSASWPDQALRVQAVASRTYLASHLGSHSSQGFDLCSDVHCQVYGGIAKEHPKTNEAVDATADEILVYEGKPIGAYFFSHCGGSTEQIEPVWGARNVPYLPRKKCLFCKENPRYTWNISINRNTILAALKAKTAVKGDRLDSIHIKAKGGSGRIRTIAVKTDKGVFNLSGNAFRIALNPEKIRSTLWTDFRRHGDGYYFAGRGWGHGVGMCQWGAKGQAEEGGDYRDILQFYYPHTELRKWSR